MPMTRDLEGVSVVARAGLLGHFFMVVVVKDGGGWLWALWLE